MEIENNECRLLTLEGRPCQRPGICALQGLTFCVQHFRRLTDTIEAEMEFERTSRFTMKLRRLARQLDVEAQVAADETRWQRLQETKRQASVYYVERDGYIKIGTATDVARRLKDLALGGVKCPPGMTFGPVTLLATHGGGQAAERAMHRKFALHRVAGEWFERAPELLEHIEAVSLGKHWSQRITDAESSSAS